MSKWPMVTLGEVVRHRKEFIQIDDFESYKRCRVQLHARGVVLRDKLPGAEIKTKKQQVCKSGELLVAEIDAKHGGYGIVPDDLDGAIVSSHYFLFEIDQGRLDRGFLGHYIRTPSFFDQVSAQGSTNYAAIRPGHVLEYTVPLPPLSEQQRIVEWIDAVATRAEEAQRLQKQTQSERQALEASWLNSLFTSPEASGWQVTPLGEIAAIQSGVTLGRSLAGETIRLPYLRVANVQDGYLDLGTIKEVEIRPDEADKWRLLDGDLLLTEGGDWDKLGRGTVWRSEIKDCIHQNHIFRVRVTAPDLDPDFLSLQTGSPYGKAYFQSASKQTTNLASINQRQLKAFPVMIPPPAEQRRLLAHSAKLRASLGEVASVHQQTKKELDAMMASILNTAFNGHAPEDGT